MSELPPDPDLDDLPDELAGAEGPLRIRGVDTETGQTFEALVRCEHIAAGFADARRACADDP